MMRTDSSDSSASSASSASWKDEEQVSTGPEQRKQREFQQVDHAPGTIHESPTAGMQLDRLDEDWRVYSALQTAFHNPLYEDIDVRVG